MKTIIIAASLCIMTTLGYSLDSAKEPIHKDSQLTLNITPNTSPTLPVKEVTNGFVRANFKCVQRVKGIECTDIIYWTLEVDNNWHKDVTNHFVFEYKYPWMEESLVERFGFVPSQKGKTSVITGTRVFKTKNKCSSYISVPYAVVEITEVDNTQKITKFVVELNENVNLYINK